MSVLEVNELSIRFGGLQALSDLTLEVNEFEIVGLIGPNGAGKTTAFNCITGFYKPDTGSVVYRGRDVTRTPPHRKAAMGFGRTFQNVGMVKSETALENLLTAQHTRAGYGAMQALKSKSGPDRAAGLSFLAILGSEAKTASREIVTSLFDTDAEARKWAGMALKEANPTISGPVLTLVQGKTYGDRVTALTDLTKLGDTAAPAIPALLKFLLPACEQFELRSVECGARHRVSLS